MKLKPQVKVGLIVLIVATCAWLGYEVVSRSVAYMGGVNARLTALESRPQEMQIRVVTPSSTPSASPSATKTPIRKTTLAPTISK